MTDGFWIGFATGAVSAMFLAFLAMCVVSDQTGSSVAAIGYRQQPVRRVYVGDNLWVSDFEYDVSPSNALVMVKFAPKYEVTR